LFTLAVALPVSVLGAWVFSQIFEMPFKRNRSWKTLIARGRSHQLSGARAGERPERQPSP
jgi:peptidoglycan/LPS O-acetylase OafA/YrhL